MTFGVDPFGRLAHAAESLVLDATEYDVDGTDKDTVEVKWYDTKQSYFWRLPSNTLMSSWRDSGYSSAAGIVDWLQNTLSFTKEKSIKFVSLSGPDSGKPIDCEMFAWGSWSDWSQCANGQQIRTRTRAVKTRAYNGGAACPTDLEQTESRSCDDGTDDDADNGDDGTDDDTDTGDDGTVGPITHPPDDPLAGGSTPTTPATPNWAVPAGITAVALVAILALK